MKHVSGRRTPVALVAWAILLSLAASSCSRGGWTSDQKARLQFEVYGDMSSASAMGECQMSYAMQHYTFAQWEHDPSAQGATIQACAP